MKEKDNMYKWIISFIMALLGYLMYRKRNAKESFSPSDLKPYDPDNEALVKQFEGDIKKNGFVVVWKEDSVAYMEDISKGFKFISYADLEIMGELAIYRDKEVVVIKPDKTYEIQTMERHLWGAPLRMVRMQCLISREVKEIINIAVTELPQIRREIDEIRAHMDEIRAHISLPKRSNSFTEMLDKSSNERVQER
jgi:hypothetical protein